MTGFELFSHTDAKPVGKKKLKKPLIFSDFHSQVSVPLKQTQHVETPYSAVQSTMYCKCSM